MERSSPPKIPGNEAIIYKSDSLFCAGTLEGTNARTRAGEVYAIQKSDISCVRIDLLAGGGGSRCAGTVHQCAPSKTWHSEDEAYVQLCSSSASWHSEDEAYVRASSPSWHGEVEESCASRQVTLHALLGVAAELQDANSAALTDIGNHCQLGSEAISFRPFPVSG